MLAYEWPSQSRTERGRQHMAIIKNDISQGRHAMPANMPIAVELRYVTPTRRGKIMQDKSTLVPKSKINSKHSYVRRTAVELNWAFFQYISTGY